MKGQLRLTFEAGTQLFYFILYRVCCLQRCNKTVLSCIIEFGLSIDYETPNQYSVIQSICKSLLPQKETIRTKKDLGTKLKKYNLQFPFLP